MDAIRPGESGGADGWPESEKARRVAGREYQERRQNVGGMNMTRSRTTIGLVVFLAWLGVATNAQSLQDGLIAWWRMEERVGDTILDASGWGHTLQIHGAPAFEPVVQPGGTLVGDMAVFNDNGTLVAEDSDALDLLGDWSISLWVREDSREHASGNPTSGWIGKVRAYHDSEGGWFLVSDNTAVWATVYGTPNFNCIAPPALILHAWYRLTATYDGAAQTVRIYRNATLAEECVGATLLPNVYPVLLGGNIEADMTFRPHCKGAIADVRIYDRKLSAGEVAALATPPTLPGDINCDGVVDFGDIRPFVDCLVNGNCGCP